MKLDATIFEGEFKDVVKEAYKLGYFAITDKEECGCYGLHCSTPNNAFYCLPMEAEDWIGTPEDYVSYIGKDNIIQEISYTIHDFVQEELNEKDPGEGCGYLLELRDLFSKKEDTHKVEIIDSLVNLFTPLESLEKMALTVEANDLEFSDGEIEIIIDRDITVNEYSESQEASMLRKKFGPSEIFDDISEVYELCNKHGWAYVG